MNGSRDLKPTQNITISCISVEARDLLDNIVSEYQKHYEHATKNNIPMTHPDDVYGAFYWLVRYSGLVEPSSMTQPDVR